MAHARFDIMIDGRWMGQITIPVSAAYEYDERYFRDFVEKERPSLQGKAFTLQPKNDKVFK